MTTADAFERLWNHDEVDIESKEGGGFCLMHHGVEIGSLFYLMGCANVVVYGMKHQSIDKDSSDLYYLRFWSGMSDLGKGKHNDLLRKVKSLLE